MTISIVTVVLNAEKTIAKALDSVASQTYPKVEHLLIDGGSKDGTLAIAREHGKHLYAIVSEPDRGLYDAMNKGARMAKGDIICFLNADDYYSSPVAIEKVVRKFSEDSFEVVYGDLEYVPSSSSGRVVRRWQSGPFRKGSFPLGWSPPHPAFFARMSAFHEVGGFRLEYKLAADADLMMRMLEVEHHKWGYIPEVLVKMRMGGATNQSWRNIVRQNREILQALQHNAIPYSLPSFVLHKLASRFWQRLAGFNVLNST